jgi:hypothetical protein
MCIPLPRTMTADDICQALLAGKTPVATRKQGNNLQAAILAALRKRNGGTVTGEGIPTQWQLSRVVQLDPRIEGKPNDQPAN